jgi:hypothetical protein
MQKNRYIVIAIIIVIIAWLVFSFMGALYFASILENLAEPSMSDTADDDDVIGEEDEYDELISEVLDVYEKKVSEQGDRFDASNGILVGVLGAQIAVFVFYADVVAKSFEEKPDYWFTVVLAILLAGIVIIGSLLFSSEYRPAPKPNLFAENVFKDGIRDARKSAIEDLDSAYTENGVSLARRRTSLGLILIITTIAILLSLVVQSVEERTPMQRTKQAALKKTANKPWGPPNSIYAYRIGRNVHEVQLGADGRPLPGSMIDRSPGIIGFGNRDRS